VKVNIVILIYGKEKRWREVNMSVFDVNWVKMKVSAENVKVFFLWWEKLFKLAGLNRILKGWERGDFY